MPRRRRTPPSRAYGRHPRKKRKKAGTPAAPGFTADPFCTKCGTLLFASGVCGRCRRRVRG